mmetsp:Transcript_116763/g.325361  ORF Transcript_116763/g.325361 Transcript_116763/m.325361 type:complete len:128 (-) Transcript_116763:499-882(-)
MAQCWEHAYFHFLIFKVQIAQTSYHNGSQPVPQIALQLGLHRYRLLWLKPALAPRDGKEIFTCRPRFRKASDCMEQHITEVRTIGLFECKMQLRLQRVHHCMQQCRCAQSLPLAGSSSQVALGPKET